MLFPGLRQERTSCCITCCSTVHAVPHNNCKLHCIQCSPSQIHFIISLSLSGSARCLTIKLSKRFTCCAELLQVFEVDQAPTQDAPLSVEPVRKGRELSERINALIADLRRDRAVYPQCFVVRQGKSSTEQCLLLLCRAERMQFCIFCPALYVWGIHMYGVSNGCMQDVHATQQSHVISSMRPCSAYILFCTQQIVAVVFLMPADVFAPKSAPESRLTAHNVHLHTHQL